MAGAPDASTVFEKAIAEHLRVIETMRAQAETLERIAGEMTRAVMGGGKVLWCGNGGSAADAQHMAAELVGRFRRERKGLAAIALTTDTSILTAVANDYGYEQVFRRQVSALCARGDVVVGISTSGNSRNVCLALEEARQMGAYTVALTGQGGGAMVGIAEAAIAIPSTDTARIQEAHILCGHLLCDWVEARVCSLEGEKDAVAR
jgi:D-sedoheptulose 7-phosphate isomerase